MDCGQAKRIDNENLQSSFYTPKAHEELPEEPIDIDDGKILYFKKQFPLHNYLHSSLLFRIGSCNSRGNMNILQYHSHLIFFLFLKISEFLFLLL